MKVQALKSVLLKAIVITLPFGGWPLLPLPYTDITFVLMYLYLLTSFATFRESFSIRAFQKYGWPLLVLCVILLVVNAIRHAPHAENTDSVLRQFIFFLVFFMFATQDVRLMALKHERLDKYFVVAMLIAVPAFFGGFSGEAGDTGRVVLIGVNANLMAMYCVTGILLLLDSLLRRRLSSAGNWPIGVTTLVLPGLFFMIMLSGSRGGVLILGAVIITYLFSWTRLSRRKLALLLPLAIVFAWAIWELASSHLMADRFADIGEDIRILKLWPTALEIVRNHPLFGGGLGYTEVVLSERLGKYFYLHNEFLRIATGAGLFGLCLFVIFLARLFTNAITYRRETGSGLYLSLFMLVVLFLAQGGSLTVPYIWVMFVILSAPSPRLQLAREGRDRAPRGLWA